MEFQNPALLIAQPLKKKDEKMYNKSLHLTFSAALQNAGELKRSE